MEPRPHTDRGERSGRRAYEGCASGVPPKCEMTGGTHGFPGCREAAGLQEPGADRPVVPWGQILRDPPAAGGSRVGDGARAGMAGTDGAVAARRHLRLAEVIPAPAGRLAARREGTGVPIAVAEGDIAAGRRIGLRDLSFLFEPADGFPGFREGAGIAAVYIAAVHADRRVAAGGLDPAGSAAPGLRKSPRYRRATGEGRRQPLAYGGPRSRERAGVLSALAKGRVVHRLPGCVHRRETRIPLTIQHGAVRGQGAKAVAIGLHLHVVPGRARDLPLCDLPVVTLLCLPAHDRPVDGQAAGTPVSAFNAALADTDRRELLAGGEPRMAANQPQQCAAPVGVSPQPWSGPKRVLSVLNAV